MEIGTQLAAVHDFFGDSDLFFELLVGVGMVRIDHAGRILQIHFFVHIPQTDQIFIMVVGNVGTMLVGSTTQHGVSQIISMGIYFPAGINKGMGMLCCIYGIQHYGEISAGWILHPCRYIKTADGQTVLLILYGTGADCHIGEDVGYITPVLRV